VEAVRAEGRRLLAERWFSVGSDGSGVVEVRV
jgi:hypothetical protein